MAYQQPPITKPGTLITASWMNTYIRDNLNGLDTLVPIGIIFPWSGSIVSIPTGWAHCNGSGGTVDLRNKFVIGAGTTYAVGATGGADSGAPNNHANHVVTQPNDHANHANPTIANHYHNLFALGSGDSRVIDFIHSGHSISGAHNAHVGFAVDAHSVHSSMNTRPPYFAKAFIQKTASALSGTPRTWVADEVVTSAQMNLEVRDYLTNLYERLLPVGVLAYAESVLSGWQQADGTNSTSDLRGKMLPAAGTDYAVDDSGGNEQITYAQHDTHICTAPTNTHATHTWTMPSTHSEDVLTGYLYGWDLATSGSHTGSSTMTHAAHSTPSISNNHAHDAMSVLPPYLALYILHRIATSLWSTPRTWITDEIVRNQRPYWMGIRDQQMYLALGPQTGLIGLWSSSIATIPSGWQHHTSLNDKIPLGVSASHAVLSTGGALSQQIAAHSNHSISIGIHASHSVSINMHPDALTLTAGGPDTDAITSPFGHSSIVISDNHSHSGQATDAHSIHSAVATLPRYHALAYIKKS